MEKSKEISTARNVYILLNIKRTGTLECLRAEANQGNEGETSSQNIQENPNPYHCFHQCHYTLYPKSYELSLNAFVIPPYSRLLD